MAEESKPIATYREVRFDGKGKFELFVDTVRVSGSLSLQSEFDTSIPLTLIQPRLIKLKTRNKLFSVGLLMTIAGLYCAIILINSFHLDPFGFAPGLAAILGLTGAILCCATFRKVEFLRFESDAGVTILDIARAGPDQESFDEFTNRLLEQIRYCRDES